MWAHVTKLRQLWRHMDWAIGITLVLWAVLGLGWSIKAWQDYTEIVRLEAQLRVTLALLATETDQTALLRQQAVQLDTILARLRECK